MGISGKKPASVVFDAAAYVIPGLCDNFPTDASGWTRAYTEPHQPDQPFSFPGSPQQSDSLERSDLVSQGYSVLACPRTLHRISLLRSSDHHRQDPSPEYIETRSRNAADDSGIKRECLRGCVGTDTRRYRSQRSIALCIFGRSPPNADIETTNEVLRPGQTAARVVALLSLQMRCIRLAAPGQGTGDRDVRVWIAMLTFLACERWLTPTRVVQAAVMIPRMRAPRLWYVARINQCQDPTLYHGYLPTATTTAAPSPATNSIAGITAGPTRST